MLYHSCYQQDNLKIKDKVNQFLFTSLGLFAGMNSISVYTNTIDITIFTILLAVIVLYTLIKERKLIFPKKNTLMKLIFCMYISSIINFILLKGQWAYANLSYLISMSIGIGGLCIFFPQLELAKYKLFFIRGLKVNSMIQLSWAILQLVSLEVYHIPLNATLHMYNAQSELSLGRQITGLGWERAELCFVLTIGYLLYNNLIIKALMVIMIILTQSRSGIVLIICAMVMSFDYNTFLQKIRKVKPIRIIEILIVLTCILGMFSQIKTYVMSLFQRFINIRSEASGSTHLWYFTQMPKILSNTPVIHLLFGYGGRNSGYAYSLFNGIHKDIVWDVESTWLQFFWSFGVIGWVYWLRWMISRIILLRKHDRFCFALFLAVLTGGLGYTLLPNWGITVLMILSSNIDNNSSEILSCNS